MKELLKVSSNERVDIGDFNHVAVNSVADQVNELIHNFLCNPSGSDQFILSGFEISNPTGSQVRVEEGKAILHQRLDGQVVESVLSTGGDSYKIVDMATYPSNTYYIYLRFEHIPGDDQGRIFWNPSGTGSEYTQTVSTRLLPNWSIRMETSSPGQEWYQIGTVIMPSMSITDQRNLFFEGTVDSSFASGWSSDGGGSVNDRSTDRETYGIVDLHTFVAATRQCLEDIKGRGIRHWYSKNIGGMNIGFDTDPTANALYIYDNNFGLHASTGGLYRYVDFASDTNIRYSSSSTDLTFRHSNDTLVTLNSSGTTIARALIVNASTGYTALTVNGLGNGYAAEIEAATGTNGYGLRGVGKGTGAGLVGMGSSTAGSYGVVGIGSSNPGVQASASGNAPGLIAVGGDGGSLGNGIEGTSGNSGTGASGVLGIAGASTHYGVQGSSSYLNGAGIYGLNTGDGSGVLAANSGDGPPLTVQPVSADPTYATEGSIWFYSNGGVYALRCYIGGSVRTIASW